MPSYNPKKLIDVKLGAMAFVCSWLVVLLHCSCLNLSPVVSSWYGWIISDGLCRVAVPYFFLAAGYNLCRSLNDKNQYRMLLISKFRSLFLPYCYWCLAYFTYRCVFISACNLAASRDLLYSLSFDSQMLLRVIGLDYTCYPLLIPMWFIRSLLILFVISPVIVFLAKRFPLLTSVISIIGMVSSPTGITEQYSPLAHFISIDG